MIENRVYRTLLHLGKLAYLDAAIMVISSQHYKGHGRKGFRMRKSFFTPLSPWAIEILKRNAVEFKVYDEWYDGYAYTVLYPNGYAASIVKFTGSYGHGDDLWEVAVMKDGVICYDTEITDDVLGYLTEADVMNTCWDISVLD